METAFLGVAGMTLSLYTFKAVLLCSYRSSLLLLVLFSVAVTLCFPLIWSMFPLPNEESVPLIAVYLGNPIGLLTIPYFSFLVDLVVHRAQPHSGWSWRWPVEILVAVPCWFIFWFYLELRVFGWVVY